MADERTLGFSIDIKGTDSQAAKISGLKREIVDVEKQISKLKESTKGNIGAQKASATQMSILETKLKGLKSEYNGVQKSIIDNAKNTKNAAGSYNDLVVRLRETTVAWRALSKEERENTEEGKKLTAQKKSLNEELKRLDASTGNHARNVGNYSNSISTLKGNLSQLAGAFGVTFAASQLIDYGREAVDLSLKAEGIERAFKKLNDPSLLDKLREATKGTVSDLDLMKNAVRAENFKIPLDVMAKGLEFAQQKAVDTGQSVDYLVDSFVTGLGRKSAPILDNLQISQVELNKEIKKTGDFTKAVSNIMDRELENVGGQALTTAQKLGKITAFWSNLKVAVGDFLVEAGNDLIDAWDIITGKRSVDDVYKGKSFELLNKALEKQNNKTITLAQESEKAREEQVKLAEQRIVALRQEGLKKETALGKEIVLFKIKNEEKLIEDLKRLHEKARVELTDKELEEIRKRNEERLAANRELIRQLQDQQVSFIKNSEEREKAAAGLRHSRAVEDIVKSKADQEVKNDALLSQQESFEKEILAIEKKYEDIHTKQRDDIHKQELADEEKDGEELRKVLKTVLYKREADQEAFNKGLKAQREQNVRDIISGAYELSKQLSDALFQNERDQNARRTQENLDFLNNRKETELIALEERLRSGQITEAQFKLEKADLDKKFQEQELEAKRKAFEDEKRLKKQQIGIELALELARIAANAAANPTNATTFGAAGVAQYAIQAGIAIGRAGIQFAAVDNAQFAKGGLLRGKSHEQGGIPFTVDGQAGFEAEGGESIINKRSTEMFRPLLSALNQAGGGVAFARGGQVPSPVVSSSPLNNALKAFDFSPFAERIIAGINDKKVIQVESDVRGVLTRVSQIESDSSF